MTDYAAQVQITVVTDGDEPAVTAEVVVVNTGGFALDSPELAARIRAVGDPTYATRTAPTSDPSTFLRGDGTWATPPTGGASPGKNMFDSTAAYGPDTFWNGASKDPISLAGWTASAKIGPIAAGQQYTINNARNVAFFDASGNPVAGYINNPSQTTVTFTVPVGATSLGFNVATVNVALAQLEAGTAATAYEPFGKTVDRLLLPVGAGGANVRATDVVAQIPPVQRLGGITVYRNGNELMVRSQRDATTDVLQPFHLASGPESMVKLATPTNPFVTVVPSATRDNLVWPAIQTAASGGTAIHGRDDDNCPINVQFSYVGANHGYSCTWAVTLTGHDKTVADLGSTWSDGTRTYTLLAVVDANTLIFAASYSTVAGVVVASTTAPNAQLTHTSGATHTSTVAISGGLIANEWHPSSFAHAVTVALDGRPLADGQKSYGQLLTIVETYQIVSYKGLIDWAQSHIGSPVAAAIAAGQVSALGRMSLTYRLAPRVGTVTFSWTPAEAVKVHAGPTQFIPLTLPAGWTRKQFMPGVGTVNGLNLSTLADMAAINNGDINITAASWLNPLTPPSRATQRVYDANGVQQYGIAVGILPTADGHPDQRRKRATGLPWFISGLPPNYFKKNYPHIAYGWSMSAGETISATAWWSYLDPSTEVTEVIVTDGVDTFAFLDRPTSTTTDARMAAPGLLGRRLEPVGVTTLTGVPSRVGGDGISYAAPATPGHGAWRLVDERTPPPALSGTAGRTPGNWYGLLGGRAQTAFGIQNGMYLFPVQVPGAMSIDRLQIDIRAAGTGNLRHGIYAWDRTSGSPLLAAPLVDLGVIDCTTTGTKGGDVDLPFVLPAGTEFVYALVWQGTNTTQPGIMFSTAPALNQPALVDLGSAVPGSSASGRLCWYMAGVSGALPTLAGLSVQGLNPPALNVRRALTA